MKTLKQFLEKTKTEERKKQAELIKKYQNNDLRQMLEGRYDEPEVQPAKIKKETKAQKAATRAEIENAMKSFKGKVKKLPAFDKVKRKALKPAKLDIYYSDDTDLDILDSEVKKALIKHKLPMKLNMHTSSSDRKTVTLLFSTVSMKLKKGEVIKKLKAIFTSKKYPVDVKVGLKGFQDKVKVPASGFEYEVVIKATKRGNVIDYLA